MRASNDYDVTEALPAGVITGENAGSKPRGKAGAESSDGKTGCSEPTQARPPTGTVSTPLLRILEPQLATLVNDPPVRGEWDYKVKFDDYRILARIDGDTVRPFGRSDRD